MTKLNTVCFKVFSVDVFEHWNYCGCNDVVVDEMYINVYLIIDFIAVNIKDANYDRKQPLKAEYYGGMFRLSSKKAYNSFSFTYGFFSGNVRSFTSCFNAIKIETSEIYSLFIYKNIPG